MNVLSLLALPRNVSLCRLRVSSTCTVRSSRRYIYSVLRVRLLATTTRIQEQIHRTACTISADRLLPQNQYVYNIHGIDTLYSMVWILMSPQTSFLLFPLSQPNKPQATAIRRSAPLTLPADGLDRSSRGGRFAHSKAMSGCVPARGGVSTDSVAGWKPIRSLIMEIQVWLTRPVW